MLSLFRRLIMLKKSENAETEEIFLKICIFSQKNLVAQNFFFYFIEFLRIRIDLKIS